jgi:hypothetical protein
MGALRFWAAAKPEKQEKITIEIKNEAIDFLRICLFIRVKSLTRKNRSNGISAARWGRAARERISAADRETSFRRFTKRRDFFYNRNRLTGIKGIFINQPQTFSGIFQKVL